MAEQISVADVKGTLDELATTMEQFKAANDERLKQLEAKGATDPITEEMVDRINTEITAIQSKMEKAQQERLDASALRERLDAIETAYKRGHRSDTEDNAEIEKKAKVFWSQEPHRQKAGAAGIEMGVEAYQAYCAEFTKYIRRGEHGYGMDTKALSVGVEADGGYWVTPEMSSRVIARVFETSPIRSIADVITIGTDAIEYPTDTNDATSGGWVGEKDSRAETATPQIGQIRIPVHEQFANPRITQKLLDDAVFDVEGWLADKIADKLARTENTAFVSGNGVARPRGFLDYTGTAVTTADSSRAWGVFQYVFTGASGGFDTTGVGATESPSDELIDVQAALKPIFRANARWVMNRATEAEVRKLRTTTGEYLVTLNTGNITGVPIGGFVILGSPIVGAEDMPDIAANSFSIAYGDFRAGYQIVDRQGIRVLRDPFSAKPFVQFYTTKRVGGDVTNFDAIKLLKFGTS